MLKPFRAVSGTRPPPPLFPFIATRSKKQKSEQWTVWQIPLTTQNQALSAARNGQAMDNAPLFNMAKARKRLYNAIRGSEFVVLLTGLELY